MRDEIRKLRAVLWRQERGRGKRYPAEIRARISDVGRRLRQDGASWFAIGAELGLPAVTVRRLCEGVGAGFAAVEVVADKKVAASSLVVVTPAGFRVEGLTVASAAALLRALA